jgi:two-component system phosphate regulon sensor histidine kinase PhoR
VDGVSLLLAALGLAAGVVALVWGAALLRALSGVVEAARSIAAGDFSARVRPRFRGAGGRLSDSFNDMAEQVEARMTAASQERSRLAAALNSDFDPVFALDSQARVVFANIAAERLFHRPLDQIVGNPFVWVVANEQVMGAVHASRDEGARRVEVIERPGRQFLQFVTTPIRDGGEWAVLVVCNDLTDERRTEQMRRDFVANVSHELRTPLAAIKSVIETLDSGAVEDPQVARDFLGRADGEVDRLIQLVEELLELSRIESGLPLTFTSVELASLLEDVVERMQPQAERKRVSLALDLPGDLGEVKVDGPRIERAVVNLIHNAIKFTPEDGSITVSAERGEGEFTVRVRDTGLGIAAEDLPRVFERFYKVDHSRSDLGSGLGLAVVKHTVEAHGGSVRVDSELGRGSAFSFSIPLAD